MLDLMLLLCALTLLTVAGIHLFLLRRCFSDVKHLTLLGVSCLFVSFFCLLASQRLQETPKMATWPYQAFDDENKARALVLQHEAHPLLKAQANRLAYGVRIKSVMGREFFSTDSLKEALEALEPKSVITAQYWARMETRELILPLEKLERSDMSRGEALIFALGVHNKGTIIWNLAQGGSSAGSLGVKSSRILEVSGQNAVSPEAWWAVGEAAEIAYTESDSTSTKKALLGSIIPRGKQSWGLLLPPKLAVPTSYTGTFLDAPLGILAAWARFLGWDITRWRDFFRHFADYPLAWYQLASLEKSAIPFWLHQLGSSFAVLGGLALAFSAVAKRRHLPKAPALGSAIILTFLFIGKNCFVVALV